MRKFRKTSARIIGVLLCVAMCLETNGFTALAAEVNTPADEEVFEVVEETTVEDAQEDAVEDEVAVEDEAPAVEEPAAEDAEEPAIEDAEEPVIEDAEEPAIEDAEEPAIEDAEEPVIEDEEEPVIEDAEEPAIEDAEEPVIEDEEEPVIEDAEETLDDDIELNGDVGEPSYNIDDETGELTVGGLSDWERTDEFYAPWYSERESIKSAKINVQNMKNLSYMFADCVNLTSVEFIACDTSAVTDFSYMFKNCTSLETVKFNEVKTNSGENFTGMFENCTSLNELDLSKFVIGAKAETKDFFNCTLEEKTVAPDKIVTPSKCGAEVLLPRKYATSKGKKYEKFPKEKTSLLIVYNISYLGGEYKNPNPTEVIYGKTITLKKPSKTGYTFVEWWNSFFSSIAKVEGDCDQTVTAIWTPISYKLELIGNGGKKPNGAGSSIKSYTIDEIFYDKSFPASIEEADKFVRDGYTLTGWNTKANGKGKSYTVEELKNAMNLTAKNNATVKLYAQWKVNEYTIVFDGNTDSVYTGPAFSGDFGTMAEKTVKYDKSINLPANKYVVPGYAFKGWSLYPNRDVEYKNKAKVKNLAKDGVITLYASWEPYTYNVKFDLNGSKGTAPATVKNLVFGKDFVIPEDIGYREDVSYANELVTDRFGNEKHRYGFSLWNTKADGMGDSAMALSSATEIYPTKNNQTITLYAIWFCNYYLDYSYYDGGNRCDTKRMSSEQTITLPASSNRRPGYYLAGWNTDKTKASKGTIQYKPGAKVKHISEKSFYAVWKPASYTVKFDKNAPEGVEVTGTMKSMTCKGDATYTLPENKFEAEGYSFIGWECDDSDDMLADKAAFSSLATSNKQVIVLKAVWMQESVPVETAPLDEPIGGSESKNGTDETPVFTLEDGVLTVNANSNWARTDDFYPPWYDKRNDITKANVKLKNVTDVSYMFADCVNLTEVNFEEVDTTAVTDFTRMFNNCTSLKELDLSKFTIGTDAKTEKFVTCTLDDKAMNLEKIVSPAKCGAEVLLPRKFADSDGKKYECFPKKKKSLSAVYYVSFISVADDVKNENKNEIILGKKMTLKKATRKGYIFDGWTDSIGNPVTEVVGNQDYTLKPNWTPIKYTLVLNGNGGTKNVGGEADNKTKTVKAEDISYNVFLKDVESFNDLGESREIFAKKGYTFVSWNTKANGKGENYTASELKYANKLTAKDGGKVTLYAIWRVNTYSIKFYSGSSYPKTGFNTQKVEYGKTVKLDKCEYLNYGYRFGGWSKTVGGEVIYKDRATVKNLSEKDNEVINLYAVWTPVTYTVKFNLNGSKGKVPASIKDCKVGVKSVDLPDLSGDTAYSLNTKKDSNGKDLYRFVGWSTYKPPKMTSGMFYTTDNLKDVTIAATKQNQVVTLYAMWEYNFCFDFSEEDVSFCYNYNVNFGPQSDFQGLDDQKKYNPGYYCIGFNTSKENAAKGKVNIKFNKNYKQNSLIGQTLYCVWKPINYKVKFDKNAPNGVKVTGSMKTMSCKGNKAYETPANNFKAPGYEFGGWLVMNSRTGIVGYVDDKGGFALTNSAEGYKEGYGVFENTKHNNDVYTFTALWSKIE